MQTLTTMKMIFDFSSKYFRQNLSKQNTRNGISEQDFKIFWKSMSPHPASGSLLRHSSDSSVIEKYPDFTYPKGWTVCVAFFQTCNPFWPAMRLLLLIACARGATTELTSPSVVSTCEACRLASCRVALERNLAA